MTPIPLPLVVVPPSRGRLTLGQFVALWVASAAWFLAAEDWPTFQHDVRRSASTTERLAVPALAEAWSVRSPNPPQSAWAGSAKWDAYANLRGLKSMREYDPVFHVIVAEGRVYYGSSSDDSVHCVDSRSGRELWAFTTDGPVRVAPTFSEGRVYFGSDDGYAYCLDAASGKEAWRFRPVPADRLVPNDGRLIPFWPCRTGVLVDQGVAYFGMGCLPWKKSYLCAVDAVSGTLQGAGRFVRELDEVTLEAALLVSSQRIISPQGRVPPLLFERATGKPLGSLEGGGGSFVLLTEDAHILHGPGNKAGWVQESYERDRTKIATFNGGTMMIVRGSQAYVQTDLAILGLDRATRREQWRTDWLSACALMLAGDTLIVGGVDQVAALDPRDGSRVWQAATQGRVYGLAAADGALFASTDEGVIHCFRPSPAASPNAVASSDQKPSVPGAPDSTNAAAVVPVQDKALLGRWVFQQDLFNGRTLTNLAGGSNPTVIGRARFVSTAVGSALEMDGNSDSALVTTESEGSDLPREAMTVEALVRLRDPEPWGGIVGAFQKAKKAQQGWLLGYVNSRFTLALATKDGPSRFTQLESSPTLEKSRWYHVAATYDGRSTRLFVNGQETAHSTERSGPILYPKTLFYEIGAHHDEDEYHRLQGLLREVRVYGRALSGDEVRQRSQSALRDCPAPLALASGPLLTFEPDGRARIEWETCVPSPTRLEWWPKDGPRRRIEETSLRTQHRVVLEGLRRNRVYEYVIRAPNDAGEAETERYECDTFFDYNLGVLPAVNLVGVDSGAAEAARKTAQQVLQTAGVQAGYCLMLGATDLPLAYELARQSQLRVLLVDTNAERVAAARRSLLAAGAYGPRITARQVERYDELPMTRCFANLVLSPDAMRGWGFPLPAAKLGEFLRPEDGRAMLRAPSAPVGGAAREARVQWLKEAGALAHLNVRTVDGWSILEREALPGARDWSHQYGTPANTAFAGEELQGASTVGGLDVQWFGRPGPRDQADRNGRKPSPLVAQGRLFIQGLERIIALDGYNGAILWSREVPEMRRFNVPRDCGNWCADRTSLFALMAERCVELDSRTGASRTVWKVLPGPRTDWSYDWGFVAVDSDRLFGSAVKRGGAFTEFWGGSDAGWYDATSGPVTHPVGSDNLFAYDRKSGRAVWDYRRGVLLNPTIALTDRHAFFIETRHPAVVSGNLRRLGQPETWQDLWLVCLDLANGKPLWERSIKPVPGEVVFYLAAGGDRLVLVSSAKKAYHVYAFDQAAGRDQWNQSFPWTKGDHGGHMARPAIVGEKLFVRPAVIELASGKRLGVDIPGGGCGTYAATRQALLFRNSTVTLWDWQRNAATTWTRLRPDCWLSTIPAAGMVLSPEAGGGCSCGSWMETSIAFLPIGK